MTDSHIYAANFFFIAKRQIRSLPVYHGARWSAWLRHACRYGGIEAENAFAGLHPSRQGTTHILPGEEVSLRLFFSEQGLNLLPALIHALIHMPSKGEFSPDSLQLVRITDLIEQKTLWLDGRFGQDTFLPAEKKITDAMVSKLCGLRNWTIRFVSPLRLPLPHGMKAGKSDVEKYCWPHFFDHEKIALTHLVAHVRWISAQSPSSPMYVDESQTEWHDMRYSAQRQIALGGIVGSIRCSGHLNRDDARSLLLGQIFGAGKNARFGLGFWEIPEVPLS